jgi:predicted DCC family thiol-disulfide oxidoreductase YuxK
MSVYFFSAVMKQPYPEWGSEYTGVLYALRGGSYGTFLGQWFGQFGTLAYWLTIYVMYLEFYGPFLMFLAAYFAPARLFMQFLFISMHLGFLLFLGVGQFPWISITSLLAFTPSEFWDYLSKRVRTPERLAIKMYYDKPCSFCRKLCLILRSFLLFPDTPVEPAQQSPKIHAILQKHNSWVVVDAEKANVRWGAMLALIRNSPAFGWLAPVMQLKSLQKLGENFYSWVANNRERLADKTAPWLAMREDTTRSSWITMIIVFDLLVIMLWANVNYSQNQPMPPLIEKALRSSNLYQPWVMFIQTPPQRSWYVARGMTKSGQVVDVYRDREGEPSLLAPKYTTEGGWDPNYRWRKFALNLWYPTLEEIRPYYAGFLCRKWNDTHQDTRQLDKIHLIYMVGGGPLNDQIQQQDWGEFRC